MARRKGLLHAIAQAQREAERQRSAEARAQTRAAKAAEKAQREYQKARLADQKYRAKLYEDSRIAQVNLLNERLDRDIHRLNNILSEAFSVDSFFDFKKLKKVPRIPEFNPGQLGIPEPPPLLQTYLPPDLSGIQKLLPGAKEKH